MTWRDRAEQATYDLYDRASSGLGLKANITIAAQLYGTADRHLPVIGTVAAVIATAAIVVDEVAPILDSDVRYATFTE